MTVKKENIISSIDQFLNEENLELYDINIANFPSISKIEVFIYSKNEIKQETYERLSYQIQRLLEDFDIQKRSYELIVSSPGIERSLKTIRHFELSLNKFIKVKLFESIKGEYLHTGILKQVTKDYLVIFNKDNELRIDMKNIKKSKIIFEKYKEKSISWGKMKLGNDIKQAIENLALEKGVTVDSMYEALVSAFRSAYMRIPGAAEEARVTLDPDSGEITVYAQELDNEGNVIKEWEPQISDSDFGRIAAQSFKQMMTTKVRDAKRATVLEAYIGREGELVTGIVTQFDSRYNQTIIDLQDAEAVIPSSERIPFERLERGNRIKALITEIKTEAKGTPIIVSRNRAEFVQRMLELEVPELTDGTVELKAIAREAGSRTKIAVYSNDPNVDPKGACVGSRGSRVRQIVNELKGEKLDVVEWREDKIRFIIEALGPADIELVEIDEDTKSAKVVVKDNQQSLAIGKEGQNARLAAKLTGYKIDIEGLGDSPENENEEENKQEEE